MSILEFLIPLEIILRPEFFPPFLWVLGSIKTFPFTQLKMGERKEEL